MSKETLALIAFLISKGQAKIVVKRGKLVVESQL
jgi:hypothetical protein